MAIEHPVFTQPVLAELEEAGWEPRRAHDISAWVQELEGQGYRLSKVAAAALASYGGLELGPINTEGPNFSNDEPLIFDPVLAGSGHYALAEELSRELGGSWYPLGEWLSSASVFVNEEGWVVAAGMDWIWELGTSVEQAIEFALMADRPLICLRVLNPNGEPWPPSGVDDGGANAVALLIVAVGVAALLAVLFGPVIVENLRCDAHARHLSALRTRFTAELGSSIQAPLTLETLCDSGDTAYLTANVAETASIAEVATEAERQGWKDVGVSRGDSGVVYGRSLTKRYGETLVNLAISHSPRSGEVGVEFSVIDE